MANPDLKVYTSERIISLLMCDGRELERIQKENKELKEENARLRKEINLLKGQMASLISEVRGRTIPYLTSRPHNEEPKKRGPPEGHKGHARPVSEPDETVDIRAERCPDCSHRLSEPIDFMTHTVEDIIPGKIITVKYKISRYWCPHCKKKVHGKSQVNPNCRFGPRFQAFIVINRIEGVTSRKIMNLLKEWFGIKVSESTILNVERKVSQELGPEYEHIGQRVKRAKVVGADETGWSVDGDNHWLWTFVTKKLTYFKYSPSRGRKVPQEVLGKDYKGTVVRDGWRAYNSFPQTQQCLVHVNRELQKVEAKRRIEPRGFMKDEQTELNRKGRPPKEFLDFASNLRTVMRGAVTASQTLTDITDRVKMAKTLDKRLSVLISRKYRDRDCQRISGGLRSVKNNMFTFLKGKGIPWHNNSAERALRPSVVVRKVSYGSRSSHGAHTHAVLRTVHDTWTRQGIPFTEKLMGYLGNTVP
jgi:transposase